jgi:uncharacterized protein YjiS (DUF1127 family)
MNTATLDHADTNPSDTSASLFFRLHSSFRQALARQRARAELENLSDHELADIGLVRSQIAQAIRPRD